MKYDKGTFVVVPNIRALRGQKAVHQALFMWLCVYADNEGRCFPSRTTLSKNLKVTVKTLDRHIQELIDLGFINKEVRKVVGDRNQTNIYQVMIIDSDQEGDKKDPQEGDKGHPQRGTKDTPRRGTGELQELYPLITQSNEDIYTSSFQEFWNEYPIKVGKKTALATWLRLKPDQKLSDRIIADVRKRIKFDNSWNTGYIQHPTTYLNQERWEDEDMVRAPIKKTPDGPYKRGKYEDDVSQVVKN